MLAETINIWNSLMLQGVRESKKNAKAYSPDTLTFSNLMLGTKPAVG